MDTITSKNPPKYSWTQQIQIDCTTETTTDRMTVSVQMNERNQTAINLSAVMSGNVHTETAFGWSILFHEPMGGIIVTQSFIVYFRIDDDHWVLWSIARTQNGNSCHCSIEKQKVHNNEWRELNEVTGELYHIAQYPNSIELIVTTVFTITIKFNAIQLLCSPLSANKRNTGRTSSTEFNSISKWGSLSQPPPIRVINGQI